MRLQYCFRLQYCPPATDSSTDPPHRISKYLGVEGVHFVRHAPVLIVIPVRDLVLAVFQTLDCARGIVGEGQGFGVGVGLVKRLSPGIALRQEHDNLGAKHDGRSAIREKRYDGTPAGKTTRIKSGTIHRLWNHSNISSSVAAFRAASESYPLARYHSSLSPKSQESPKLSRKLEQPTPWNAIAARIRTRQRRFSRARMANHLLISRVVQGLLQDATELPHFGRLKLVGGIRP